MTRLEAIRARAEAGFRPRGPDDGLGKWCDYADDDRSWLLARVKELEALVRQCSSVRRADEIRAALAALDETT